VSVLERDYALLMAEYNGWMNDKLYALCAQLSDEERKRDRGAFFKSIHGTLNHLLWADQMFLARLHGEPLPPGGPETLVFDGFKAMQQERRRLDDRLLAWARSLQEDTLSRPYDFRSVTYRRRRRMPLYLMVVQMFNHQTHHRGQITTLLSQLGLDIGSTDLPFMPFADGITENLPLED
jgi:uncharacterized damage-inducible protein DinB